ncbi:MAG: Hsp20 family protein [Actinomycetota bacterium]|nr:Hsp20 family protein [Actinomycetota bacterium]
MNKVATQRPSRPLLSDLTELIETLPAFAALRPLFEGRAMRIEEELYEDCYEVRAELPGIDPDDDIDVTVRDGRLTISAQRPGPDENCGRSEFQYGAFSRTLTLPDGADADEINAIYDRGILTVSVPLSDEHRLERHVEIVEILAVDDEYDDDDDDDDHDGDAAGHDEDQVFTNGADQHEPA